uniref:Uncharacterized protein n=1 Tax=Strombidium inclinatum TaxID=197538 RepID=A0A7S3IW42_9SPIT
MLLGDVCHLLLNRLRGRNRASRAGGIALEVDLVHELEDLLLNQVVIHVLFGLFVEHPHHHLSQLGLGLRGLLRSFLRILKRSSRRDMGFLRAEACFGHLLG